MKGFRRPRPYWRKRLTRKEQLMQRWQRWCLCLTILLSCPKGSWGILGVADIVFDPSNYASNLIQQYEALKQTINDGIMIANQAKALEQQAQGLIYQAQNLQANPLKLAAQIAGLWSQYNGVLNTVDGMTYSLNQSASRFGTLYPDLAGSKLGTSMAEISANSAAFLKQIREAGRTAVKSQSVYEQLCTFQQQNDQALQSAQAAVGELQVMQAQAQQQALANQQLGTLAEIEAANGRLQAAWIMKQVQEEEAARASQERWMDGFGTQGFRGVKEGKGVTLP